MMTPRILKIACLVLILSAVSRAGTYSGGSGTEINPYQISETNDWLELVDTAADWSAYFILTADIDLSGVSPVEPVGISSRSSFTGVFDGDGYVISNATVTLPSNPDFDNYDPTIYYNFAYHIGLFGYVGSNGSILDLGVEDIDISETFSFNPDIYGVTAGPLAGCSEGDINNCYATGTVDISTDKYAWGGGLVGYNNGGTIDNCYADSTIIGDSTYVGGNSYFTFTRLGGLVGSNIGAVIEDSYATGAITGTGRNTASGGLVGFTGTVQGSDSSTIDNCYATGTVTGDQYNGYGSLGGLVGAVGTQYSTVSYSYATGTVIGESNLGINAGGLVGGLTWGTISNCYATGSVDASSDGYAKVGGLIGQNYGGTGVGDCMAAGLVIGYGNDLVCVGGLVGYNYLYAPISRCCATGMVKGNSETETQAGGLVGYNQISNISDCYAKGLVIGNSDSDAYVGGLVGYSYGQLSPGGPSAGITSNCYSTGFVTGSGQNYDAGGLVGYESYGTVSDCFWDTETSGMDNGIGDNDNSTIDVTGLTTAQMKAQVNFTDAGWDFVDETANGTDDIWAMSGYPVLSGIDEIFFDVIRFSTQGTKGYFTIQSAIDDASDFDEIVVYPGTYYEQIVFGSKDLVVRSVDPNDWDIVAATVIDANVVSPAWGDWTVSITGSQDYRTALKGLTVTGGGAGVYIAGSAGPNIENCIIRDNSSYGIRTHKSAATSNIPLLMNNKVYDNGSYGICCVDYNHPCDIVGNWIYANVYGLVFLGYGGTVENNTIVDNSELGIWVFSNPNGCDVSVVNSIVWDNGYNSSCNLDGTFTSVEYSCIEGGYGGTGNISSDPNFVDAANDDYHLSAGSPCIDAGDPNGVYTGLKDIDNDDRVIGDEVDMGADEVSN